MGSASIINRGSTGTSSSDTTALEVTTALEEEAIGMMKDCTALLESTSMRVFAPKAIGLLSQYPFFETYKTFLTHLYRVSVSLPHLVPLENIISSVLGLQLPPLGGSTVLEMPSTGGAVTLTVHSFL